MPSAPSTDSPGQVLPPTGDQDSEGVLQHAEGSDEDDPREDEGADRVGDDQLRLRHTTEADIDGQSKNVLIGG